MSTGSDKIKQTIGDNVIEFPPPIYGTITQEWSDDHQAVDFACTVGRPVWAVTDGETTRHYSSRMGWVVTVVSPDGTVTSYSHLHEAFAPGDVKQGDTIGLCGNTGSWSSGPHLHFEANTRYYF